MFCLQASPRTASHRPTNTFTLAASLITFLLSGLASPPNCSAQPSTDSLPGTTLLSETTPLSDRILDGTQRFLLNQLQQNRIDRTQRWKNWLASGDDAWAAHQTELRNRLVELTGSHDPRATPRAPYRIAAVDSSTNQSPTNGPLPAAPSLIAEPVQWDVMDGYSAHGFLVHQPKQSFRGTVILLPDSDVEVSTLFASENPTRRFTNELAAADLRVVIVQPIRRTVEKRGGRVDLTDSEYVYRITNVLGRHPVGIEIQSLRALLDGLALEHQNKPLALVGHGDGGFAALLTAAIDTRVETTLVSAAWGSIENTWQQPIGRNLFGLQKDFGDAQLATLIAPRKLIIEAATMQPYRVDAPGAAPGEMHAPTLAEIQSASNELQALLGRQPNFIDFALPSAKDGNDNEDLYEFGSTAARNALLVAMGIAPQDTVSELHSIAVTPFPWDAKELRRRQLDQLERLSDHWTAASRETRKQWLDQVDTSSLEAYSSQIAPHRERFYRDVIGRWELPMHEPKVRSRLWRSTDKWRGYEVEMDLFPDVIAGGILLVPNDVDDAQPRPAVVCVHGLEGKPLDTIEKDHYAYHDFAARLCERGFVVFCPQQLYLGHDRFRVLQRQSNPLGKTLFSILIPQHQQIVNYLKGIDYVDEQRIAFYGLSYGGKSAMRIPSVVTDYCASICSADYNEWVLKNVSPRDSFSYVWTPEYEIFEYNLARTFNYAEMAALICPRPFMVERGHFDGVGIDRWVAFEYAPVRFLYAAKLGIPERTEIEWFVGPHTINGQGTFRFLDRHLQWDGDAQRPAIR